MFALARASLRLARARLTATPRARLLVDLTICTVRAKPHISLISDSGRRRDLLQGTDDADDPSSWTTVATPSFKIAVAFRDAVSGADKPVFGFLNTSVSVTPSAAVTLVSGVESGATSAAEYVFLITINAAELGCGEKVAVTISVASEAAVSDSNNLGTEASDPFHFWWKPGN